MSKDSNVHFSLGTKKDDGASNVATGEASSNPQQSTSTPRKRQPQDHFTHEDGDDLNTTDRLEMYEDIQAENLPSIFKIEDLRADLLELRKRLKVRRTKMTKTYNFLVSTVKQIQDLLPVYYREQFERLEEGLVRYRGEESIHDYLIKRILQLARFSPDVVGPDGIPDEEKLTRYHQTFLNDQRIRADEFNKLREEIAELTDGYKEVLQEELQQEQELQATAEKNAADIPISEALQAAEDIAKLSAENKARKDQDRGVKDSKLDPPLPPTVSTSTTSATTSLPSTTASATATSEASVRQKKSALLQPPKQELPTSTSAPMAGAMGIAALPTTSSTASSAIPLPPPVVTTLPFNPLLSSTPYVTRATSTRPTPFPPPAPEDTKFYSFQVNPSQELEIQKLRHDKEMAELKLQFANLEKMILDRDKSSKEESYTASVLSKIAAQFQHSKLSPLTLPKFNGDRTQWSTFFNAFYSLVHRHEHISEVEKMTYLINAMTKNSEAAQVVQGFKLEPEAYLELLDFLKVHFGSTRVMFQTTIQELVNKPKVTKLQEARDLLNYFNIFVRRLRGKGLTNSDPLANLLLLSIFNSKMPKFLSQRWSLDCNKKETDFLKRNPSYKPKANEPDLRFNLIDIKIDDFLSFMDMQIKSMEETNAEQDQPKKPQNQSSNSKQQSSSQPNTYAKAASSTGSSSNSNLPPTQNLPAAVGNQQTNKNHNNQQRGNNSNQNNSSQKKKKGLKPPKNPNLNFFQTGCLWCGDTNHESDSCNKYQPMTLDDRWDRVLQRAQKGLLCFRCLKTNHGSSQCPLGACPLQGCSLLHHQSLHKSNPHPRTG